MKAKTFRGIENVICDILAFGFRFYFLISKFNTYFYIWIHS